MMEAVGENEPGQEPAGDWSAEQIRRFQEFQRFQAYLRFSEGQGGPQQQPGGELVPVQPAQSPPPGAPGPFGVPAVQQPLDAQLAGMREQLDRIERVANPPWWRKLLRSRLVRWPVLLLILAAIGVWGVPALVNHYIGGSAAPAGGPGAQLPAPKTASGELPQKAKDAVAELYRAIGENAPGYACFLFDQQTSVAFGNAFGVAGCEAAVPLIHQRLTDPNSYSEPDLSQLPNQTATQTTMTISSCQFTVSGGPRLGTFTLTKVSDGGWEITGYTAQQPCPSTTTPTTAPTG